MGEERRSARRTVLAAGLAGTLAGIGPAVAEAPLRVLATVGMIGDVAAELAGDCAVVETLIGPGVDPHYYTATPSDVDRLARAELILYVDPALEEQLARVLARFSTRTPAVGVLTAALGPDALLADPEDAGTPDPHAWMDVSRWARILPVLADALTAARPGCADGLAQRAAALEAELAALHGWVGAAIASIPAERRMLVTAHDAFGYFADAYGITASEAIEGLSTAAEASIADIRAVADFVVANGVPAVFVETTVSPRTIAALVQEVRSRGTALEIGGTLFSDALGDPDTPEGSYIGMIRANTVTIVTALGGTLPAWPAELAGWAARWAVEG